MFVCRFKGCKRKLSYGAQKWCAKHKKEVRRKQMRKAHLKYKKKHGKGLTPKKVHELLAIPGHPEVRVLSYHEEPRLESVLKPVESLLPAGAELVK